MDLLTNAIESIQVGVEDYQLGTRPRLLSAVRNIHSGILLLFKEALREVSPPDSNNALMMAVIAPSRSGTINKISFVGVGTKTANARQIEERFNSLGIKAEWERFHHINRTRNEVEHLFPKLDQKALRGLISDALIVVRGFIYGELNRNPADLLGQKTWQAMLEVAEVYEVERRECDELIAKANWKSPVIKAGVQNMACLKCGGGPLEPFEDSEKEICLECKSCGTIFQPPEYEMWAEEIAILVEEDHATQEGRDMLYRHCPSCSNGVYLLKERRCTACGFQGEPV
jgi:hypothetical protein